MHYFAILNAMLHKEPDVVKIHQNMAQKCEPIHAIYVKDKKVNKNLYLCLQSSFAKIIIICSDLSHIRDREIAALSGGELQRFACAMVCIQNGDIFMFDEPSSYLDVKQRLNAARTIRSLIHPDKYVLVLRYNIYLPPINYPEQIKQHQLGPNTQYYFHQLVTKMHMERNSMNCENFYLHFTI